MHTTGKPNSSNTQKALVLGHKILALVWLSLRIKTIILTKNIMEKAKVYIFGAGYGGRKMADFLGTLAENGIETVIDVRSIPASWHWPAFAKNNLIQSLSTIGIFYSHEGKSIGGKLKNIGFHKKIVQISKMAKQGERLCILCAESDPIECHRTTLLKPAFAKHGVELKELSFSE